MPRWDRSGQDHGVSSISENVIVKINEKSPFLPSSAQTPAQGSIKINSQIVEKGYNFLDPPPKDNLDYFEFGKSGMLCPDLDQSGGTGSSHI